MKNTFRFTLALLAGIATLAFTGCGGDGGSDPTGPSGAGAFAGASMSFNPTVNFLAGNAITYINTEAGSPFPAAAVATAGTYTYVPNANFTSGTLTLTITGVTDPIVLQIGNFRRSGPNVTGFTARVAGQNYPVTVTGTIEAYQRPASGGGGNSVGLVNATTDINASTQGTYELTFFNAFGEGQVAGSPYNAGDKVNFVIGARTLQVGNKTLTNPKNPSSSLTDYVYQDGNVWYWVYGGLTPVRINVYGGNPTQNGVVFYGGFEDQSEPPADAGVTVETDGSFAAGSVFFASSTNRIESTLPSGTALTTPAIPESTSVRFEIANNGDLRIGNGAEFGIVTKESTSITANTFTLVSGGNSDTVTINKDLTTGQPIGVSIYYVRNQISPFKTTTVTYTFSID